MPRSGASHLGLHCLLRPVCPNTYGNYGTSWLWISVSTHNRDDFWDEILRDICSFFAKKSLLSLLNVRKNFIAKCNLAKGFVKISIAPGEWGYSSPAKSHAIRVWHTRIRLFTRSHADERKSHANRKISRNLINRVFSRPVPSNTITLINIRRKMLKFVLFPLVLI